MSDSSDSDFEGFPDASFDVNVVPRQNDIANSDSGISLGEDLSDEEDDHNARVGDAGGNGTFFEWNSNVNIPQFTELTGPRHTAVKCLGARIFDAYVHR